MRAVIGQWSDQPTQVGRVASCSTCMDSRKWYRRGLTSINCGCIQCMRPACRCHTSVRELHALTSMRHLYRQPMAQPWQYSTIQQRLACHFISWRRALLSLPLPAALAPSLAAAARERMCLGACGNAVALASALTSPGHPVRPSRTRLRLHQHSSGLLGSAYRA